MRRGSCAYFGGGPKLECYGTDFFHISEPKNNIVEKASSNATALRTSLSACIAEPEPNIKIVSLEPNLQSKSSNVAEDEAHRVETLFNTTWMLDAGQ